MKTVLNIPQDGALDFLSLGALVHRLDPGIIPFRKATHCDIHVSGGEFNCAANLSDCFRLKTGIVSAMVDYPIGDLIAERVRAMGVKPFYKHFQHDGVHGPNMATVYSDRGQGVRAPVVFYNRCNEAAAQLKPGDFNWKEIFGQGVRWFHSGGIFAALSATTAEVIVEAMKAAKAAGAVISFDLNYRAKLWNIVGRPRPGQRRARPHCQTCGRSRRQRGGFAARTGHPRPGSPRRQQARSRRLLQHDGQRRQKNIPISKSSPPPCAKFTRPIATVGARSPGSTARPSPRPPANWTSWTASAAATATRRVSFTACSLDNPRRRR